MPARRCDRGCQACAPVSRSFSRARSSSTAEPKPPISELSSTVTMARQRRACSKISASSSGLMKRALTTVALKPSAASRSAAPSDGMTIVPAARIATSFPSRRSSPRPIGSRCIGSFDRYANSRAARVADCDRSVLDRKGRLQHVAKFVFIFRGHDRHARNHRR